MSKARKTPRTARELEAERKRLERELARVERRLAKATDNSSGDQHRRRRPLRGKVLDVLEDFDWPCYSRLVAQYSEARYGEPIPLSRFGALSRDERASFTHGRPRSVHVCHAITYDRGEAIKRLLARSDWELARRIVAPTTGRVQHLKMTLRLCELALEDSEAADPDKLLYLAADHARDLPGVKVRSGTFDLEGWREIAEAELARVEAKDLAKRRAAAKRLASAPEAFQLFGFPEVVTDETGTPAARRRSA